MDDRVVDVEVKMAFLEKGLLDLDAVVRELAEELREVRRELAYLRERVDAGQDVSTRPEEERPPHYSEKT